MSPAPRALSLNRPGDPGQSATELAFATTNARQIADRIATAAGQGLDLARGSMECIDEALLLQKDLERHYRRARDLRRLLARADDKAAQPAAALERDLDRARVLLRACVHDLSPNRARGLCRQLSEAGSAADRLSITIHRDRQGPQIVDKARVARPVTAASQLADCAARVLPRRFRDRYANEFRSELHELVVTGASRWGQVMYGLRLVDRAWVLRAELQEATLHARSVRS